MAEVRPLILVTNDDGVDSPGLRAAARAVLELGQILVVAPCAQWSGASRSLTAETTGVIRPHLFPIDGRQVEGFCVDGTPAQTVLHGVLEVAPRRPDLLVAGVNYGENLGTDVTISGTIGAALQGAACGIPALAVSIETPKEMHTVPSDRIDFTAAVHFTRLFARATLRARLPFDVDVLKIDVPDDATPQTPWRITRVSRHVHYRPLKPRRTLLTQPTFLDYETQRDRSLAEPDSDVYAVMVDRIVSVAPLSLDLSARTDWTVLEAMLNEGRQR